MEGEEHDSFRLHYMLCVKVHTNAKEDEKEIDLAIGL